MGSQRDRPPDPETDAMHLLGAQIGGRTRAMAPVSAPPCLALTTHRDAVLDPGGLAPPGQPALSRARTSWRRKCLSMPRIPRILGLSWRTDPRSRSSILSR